jgi:hypothetical protein
MFDMKYNDEKINLFQEIITHDTVLKMFKKYNISFQFDLLSEDTDYADFWIIEEILKEYRPIVVVHEVNQQQPPLCVTVPKPEKNIIWQDTVENNVGDSFHGASVCAFHCLAKNNDYTMVYCEGAGVNCFWIKNRYLKMIIPGIDIEFIQKILSPEILFRQPGFVYKPLNKDKKWFVLGCDTEYKRPNRPAP